MSDEDPVEHILKKAAEIDKTVNAPPRPLSTRLQQFAAEMAQDPGVNRGAEVPPPFAARRESALVKESLLRLLILRLIDEAPLDGPSVVRRVKGMNFALKESGDLFLYAVLYDLEWHGLLQGRRNIESTEIVKTYHLTNSGTALLRDNPDLGVSFSTIPI